MVQDLWIINEAVIPLHLMVPNSMSSWVKSHPSLRVLDLKDTFFFFFWGGGIPLAKESQHIFDFY